MYLQMSDTVRIECAQDWMHLQTRDKARREFAETRKRTEARQQAEMEREQTRRARYGHTGHHSQFATEAESMYGELPAGANHQGSSMHANTVIRVTIEVEAAYIELPVKAQGPSRQRGSGRCKP